MSRSQIRVDLKPSILVLFAMQTGDFWSKFLNLEFLEV